MEIEIPDLEFEEICRNCHGTGKDYGEYLLHMNKKRKPPIKECATCKGQGMTPSEFGEKLIKFLQKHQHIS